ncbi:MAG TPA: DUF5335 family protein [Longimicrobium sp.]|nr:DUF5335 family protein [Longimicrobium sp.]
MDAALDRSQWPRSLADFTHQNAGRTSRLEIDDPEMGAQPAENGLPLRGITYDPADDRVEIMLGDPGAGARHLTHSVAHPDRVDVTASDPRHAVLRITHGQGQTLLTVG